MDLQGKFLGPALNDNQFSHPIDAVRFEDLASGGTTAYSSPGIPSYDANMSSTPSSMSNLATVSPYELHIDHFSSAPNSAAITNLTSPSLPNESPDFLDSYEASPLVGAHEADSDNWFPLFGNPPAAGVGFNMDNYSPVNEPKDLESTEPVSRPRVKSSGSPPTKTRGVSEGGVTKPKKPLPAITVDDQNDTVAMKRARNTLAARKSRARKAEKMEYYEKRIEQLEEEVAFWKEQAQSKSS
ncbi:cross-pathway control protein 1 [Annulohypoxylon maeteangense]|uniref:cross-pathway control protein 1 n=1 Tax=Annulohypoxylon maeteangense TaxID=1927788 RepID=UPI00200777C2|nr:cross-pathway control protein 1 [Annulohypoxylon maeteangense]KAI0887839.1 cross-pathway control protein 1 [Annulohypoxylon maeteangense]